MQTILDEFESKVATLMAASHTAERAILRAREEGEEKASAAKKDAETAAQERLDKVCIPSCCSALCRTFCAVATFAGRNATLCLGASFRHERAHRSIYYPSIWSVLFRLRPVRLP
jgi:hypothetical protein